MHLRSAPFTVNAAPHKLLSFAWSVSTLSLHIVVSLGLLYVHLGMQHVPFHQISKVNHL